MKKMWIVALGCSIAVVCFTGLANASKEVCIACHSGGTPGLVADWKSSKHSENGVTCSVCHGDKHKGRKTVHLVQLPDEHVCAKCHQDQFDQFSKGKHNFGWTTMNAMPVTHVEPDELMEGGRGCGGCHNMGIKSESQKKEQRDKGYRYQNNSCDECHTRHTFSKKEAQDPRACQQCHMGYDHPQWEMWSSSKHGTRYFVKEKGKLPENAAAPSCQFCHLPGGSHTNKTAWGFLGVRLPLPEDKEWAADRVTILKALGVLNPKTGEPTARLEVVKAVDLARLTEEAWRTEREKMINICGTCHSKRYAREQLAMGDAIIKKADRLMAEAIKTVAALYKDGIIKKPDNYAFAYPDFLYFMRTGGGDMDQMSHVDQILFQMYMKHRMRTYQGFFHVNPDYAYWYGWAMMTKDLGEIKELAKVMRAAAKMEK
ncbi:MAG: multiheme c-type cytochrome [Spirochaetales bacterium]|jgi:hydroxylamine dehydrogenase|nr:multiheme c-type cytochrome [Spirochaetales bacterium]